MNLLILRRQQVALLVRESHESGHIWGVRLRQLEPERQPVI
jgi:hypothetical protein